MHADAALDASAPDVSVAVPPTSADVPQFTPPDAEAGSVEADLPAVDIDTPAVDISVPDGDMPAADPAAPDVGATAELPAPELPSVDANAGADVDVSVPTVTAELPSGDGASGALGVGSKKRKGSLFKGMFSRKKGDTGASASLPSADLAGVPPPTAANWLASACPRTFACMVTDSWNTNFFI